MVSGLDVRYDVRHDGAPDPAPLLGARMPDLDLTVDGRPTTVARLLHDGHGVLLDLTEDGTAAERFRAARPAGPHRVRVVTARPVREHPDGAVFLLRPDGHVVWTDRARTPPARAARRWFGA
ncbi:hypothetical protein ACFY93_05190 [Streptomyces sp. NPDC008313]|uniref:aromatic-ring hydroxylase C-terminal domain-containing protein n=1 Tax=Streptomyces sp. NPDC008313 TaxID=3364826 RepID=UPI0036F15AFB